MPAKWKELWGKHHKKVLTVMGCICAALVLVTIIGNAQRIQSSFDPDKYAKKEEKKNNPVEYDSSVFDSDQADDGGLEMDDNADNNKDLADGDDKILDKNKNHKQGLQMGNGSGDGSNSNHGAAGAVNDGNGPTINGNGTGTDANGGTGTGNGTGNGAGSGNGSGTGSGDNGGGNGDAGGGSGTDEPTKDNEDDNYRTDYDSPENVSPYKPKPGVAVKDIVVSGSLKQHFYQGEAPRIAEMAKYITVTAILTDGTTQELYYSPSAKMGGDYTVTWQGGQGESNNLGYPKVGNKVGEYQAIITYGSLQKERDYDVIKWQLTIKDFEENYSQLDGLSQSDRQDANEYQKVFQPDNSPVFTLSQGGVFAEKDDPMQEMYARMQRRAELNISKKTAFTYVNVWEFNVETNQNDYLYYFGGWSEKKNDQTSVGPVYEMKRPTQKDIKNGEYNVFLYPVYRHQDASSDYVVVLDGSGAGEQIYVTRLVEYRGNDTVLNIPDGVDIIDYASLEKYSASKCKKITTMVLPNSITELRNSRDYEAERIEVVNTFPNLKEYKVASSNQNYVDVDGVLYDKTGKTLLSVPAGKQKINEWSKYIETIEGSAFQWTNLNQLTVPASVTSVKAYGFYNAAIKMLTFECKGELSLGMNALESLSGKTPQINEITLGANHLAFPDGQQSLYFNSTSLSATGYLNDIKIIVDDSGDEDAKGENAEFTRYLAILKDLQYGMEVGENPFDPSAGTSQYSNAFSVLSSKQGAEKTFENTKDGFLYSQNHTRLAMVSKVFMNSGITVSDGIKEIGPTAFENCNEIEEITISSSVDKIGNGAFNGTDGLRSIFMQGENPPVFGAQLFGEVLPDCVFIYVPASAYEDYLEKARTVVDTDYGAGATEELIHGAGTMKEVNGSYYLVDADSQGNEIYRLFKANKEMSGTFTPIAGTVELKDGCFEGCSSLNGICIPDTVHTIGKEIFKGCTKLNVIAVNTSQETKIAKVEEQTFGEIDKSQIELYVPTGRKEAYAANGWSGFKASMDPASSYEEECRNSGNGIIYGKDDAGYHILYYVVNTSTDYLQVSKELKSLPKEVFAGKKDIRYVGFTKEIGQIEAGAFENCTSLRRIVFQDKVQEMGKACFKNCTSMTEIISSPPGTSSGTYSTPYGLTVIPESCFEGCSSLKVMGLHKSGVMKVEAYAFKDCSSLKTVLFSEEFGELGTGCFMNCTNMTEIEVMDAEEEIKSLPYQLKKIPDRCFENCTSLNDVAIPNELQSIGERAFYGCRSLKTNTDTQEDETFKIPEQVTTIGKACFAQCVALKHVVFDRTPTNITDSELKSVEQILKDYFEGCSLTSLKMGEHTLLPKDSTALNMAKQTEEKSEATESKETESKEVDSKEAESNLTESEEAESNKSESSETQSSEKQDVTEGEEKADNSNVQEDSSTTEKQQ